MTVTRDCSTGAGSPPARLAKELAKYALTTGWGVEGLPSSTDLHQGLLCCSGAKKHKPGLAGPEPAVLAADNGMST